MQTRKFVPTRTDGEEKSNDVEMASFQWSALEPSRERLRALQRRDCDVDESVESSLNSSWYYNHSTVGFISMIFVCICLWFFFLFFSLCRKGSKIVPVSHEKVELSRLPRSRRFGW